MVGDEFVAEGFADFTLMKEEGTGHALHVSGGEADKMALEPGEEHAIDVFPTEKLDELGADQAEGLIEARIGISEKRKIGKIIGGEENFGFFFSAEVDESKLRAPGFDLCAFFGELGDRLAAKSSTEVAEEHQEKRRLNGKRSEGLAVLRAEGIKQLWIDFFQRGTEVFEMRGSV